MNRFVSFREAAVVLAVFAAWCLAGPATAARAVEFSAAGSFTVTYAKGNKSASDLEGRSSPGGPFTGETAGHWRGKVFYGSATFDYAEGSLQLVYSVAYDAATGSDVGTWEVIDGTGVFEGATGGGAIIITGDGSGGGTFTMSGDID